MDKRFLFIGYITLLESQSEDIFSSYSNSIPLSFPQTENISMNLDIEIAITVNKQNYGRKFESFDLSFHSYYIAFNINIYINMAST